MGPLSQREGGREGRAYRVISQGEERVERAERGLHDGNSNPGPEGAGGEAAGMDAGDVELGVLGREGGREGGRTFSTVSYETSWSHMPRRRRGRVVKRTL
jgi:hypothetical protein